MVREENALDGGAFRQSHRVLVLADLVPLDILNGIEQPTHAVRADWAVAHCQDIVLPAGACDDGCALWPVYPIGDAEQSVYPHVVCACGHGDEAVAEGHGQDRLTLGQLDAPIVPLRPCLMRSVKDDSRGVVPGRAREERALFVQARLVVEEGVGEVEVSVELVVVKLDRDRVVRVLVYRPHEPDQVETQVLAVAPPGGGTRLEGRVQLGLDEVATLARALPVEAVVVCRTFPGGVQRVSSPVIVDDEAVVIISVGLIEQVVEAVQGAPPRTRRQPVSIRL